MKCAICHRHRATHKAIIRDTWTIYGLGAPICKQCTLTLKLNGKIVVWSEKLSRFHISKLDVLVGVLVGIYIVFVVWMFVLAITGVQ